MKNYSVLTLTLVTGGAGFLCERLFARGGRRLCMDIIFTGTKCNILRLRDNPHFKLMRHGVTFPLYVEVDEICNLACPASTIHYQHDPVQSTKTSVHDAINMLGLLKRTKAWFFQTSTSDVYVDTQVYLQSECGIGAVSSVCFRVCYDECKQNRSISNVDEMIEGVVRLCNFGKFTMLDLVKSLCAFICSQSFLV